MSFLLPHLETKKAVDDAIKGSEDKVLVLRFGRDSDGVCMQLDDIVSGLTKELMRSRDLLSYPPIM